MEINLQVSSLEFSQYLKDLKVKQDSYFMWIIANHPTEKSGTYSLTHRGSLEGEYNETPVSDGWTLTSWSAFSVAELGEMLPNEIAIEEKGYYFYSEKNGRSEWASYYKPLDQSLFIPVAATEKTEADARALLLIKLIELNLWKP